MTSYKGLGSLKQMTLGNGITLSFDYDNHNREALRSYKLDAQTLYEHEIQTRDNQGNILAEQIITESGTQSVTIDKSYTYDALDRLETATQTSKADLSWTYDREGNWTATNQNITPETRIVGNDNQYTDITGMTTAYDVNGNMTAYNGQTFVYDWADRLIQVKEGSIVKQAYYYDAMNRRVRLTDTTTGDTTEYVYNGSQVIEEYKNNTLDKTFVYADYIDDPIVMTSGTDQYYYIKDRQFNIKAVTDAAGIIVETYDYSAYGVMTIFDNQGADITAAGSAIGNPYGYTGRRWDAYTSLWYYRNRMYSPALGRFMQKDPAGYVDGLNLYAYVLNNPLRYTDPMGLTANAPEWYNDGAAFMGGYGSDNNTTTVDTKNNFYQASSIDKFQYTNNVSLNSAKVVLNTATNLVNTGISAVNSLLYGAQHVNTFGVADSFDSAKTGITNIFKNIGEGVENTFNNTIDYYSNASVKQVASDAWDITKYTGKQLLQAETYEKALTFGAEAYLGAKAFSSVGNLNKTKVIAPKSTGELVHVGERTVIQEGQFVNRMFDSRAGQAGANVSGPLGRSFSPGSGIPTTASEGIQQRGLNMFYPNNAQEAIIYRVKESVPAIQRKSIGGTAPEILIDPQYWNKLEAVRQFSVTP